MKLFTWNLQRGRTLFCYDPDDEDGRHIAALRLKVLSELCRRSDYGMITEPGVDLRDQIKLAEEEPIDGGFLVMDMRGDNQFHTAACRPALWMRQKAERAVAMRLASGGDDAQRFPVVQHVRLTGTHSILVASIHATSGAGLGRRNADGLVTALKNYCKRNGIGGLIAGGDFNAHVAGAQLPDIAARRNGWTWSMPDKPTNQSAAAGAGGGIDGFFFFTNAKCAGPVVFDVGKPRTYYERYPARFSLTLTERALGKALPNRAARKAHTQSDTPGFAYFTADHAAGDGHRWWWRLSDHAPVVQDVSMRLMSPAAAVVGHYG